MKIAVIRCVGDSEKLKYRSMKERYRHNRYHSILNDLRFHGAERLEAAQAAAWAQTAEAGEKNTEKNYRKYTENRQEKKQ